MATTTIQLPPGKVLTVRSDAAGGTLTRLANLPGGGANLQDDTLAATGAAIRGPFATQTRWQFPATFAYSTADAESVADDAATVRYFDDFTRKAFDETNEQWILNSGSDDLAVDPAIVVAAGGTAFLDAGDGDGTVAVDGSHLAWAIPVTAGAGGLACEARVKIEDISEVSVNIGFTDVTTLEEPFSIDGSDVITSTASDAVCFVWDSAAATAQWFACGVAGDTDATGNGATGVAPADDTYQVLRIEVDEDGGGAAFYVNGLQVGTLTASAVTAATSLYFTAIINGDGSNAAAVGLTVDYVLIEHNR